MIAQIFEGIPNWITIPLMVVGWFLGLCVMGWAYRGRWRR